MAAKKIIKPVVKNTATQKPVTAKKKKIKPWVFPLDRVCELIIEGNTLKTIALKIKMGESALNYYLAKPEFSARAREAKEISADSFADKGEQVLLDIKPKATIAQVTQARELAQHYRWKAGKRNPKAYGDKLDVTQRITKVGKDLAEEQYD